MSLYLPSSLVETFAGGLLGGITVDDGPTAEQIRVLNAVVTHVWNRPDLNVTNLRIIGPAELADRLGDHPARTMFHELHLTLEVCRHPPSPAQVQAVEEYAKALDVDGQDLEIFRSLVDSGVEAAAADYQRFLVGNLDERVEPSLRDVVVDPDHPEIALAEKLGTFAEYGPQTLGHAYISFYERSGLSMPGVEPGSHNHFFVAHDMTHTIAGLSTSVAAEIALSAFQFAMNNNQTNRAALLASLVTHEAGFAHPAHLAHAETGLLAHDFAAQLLGQELKRGSQCRGDFSLVDHFEIAPMNLTDIRAEFGVAAPANAHDGHHWW
ncbi:MAG: hypothetical protein WAO41_09785 [Candidatus Nanopelagicales bacterium]